MHSIDIFQGSCPARRHVHVARLSLLCVDRYAPAQTGDVVLRVRTYFFYVLCIPA